MKRILLAAWIFASAIGAALAQGPGPGVVPYAGGTNNQIQYNLLGKFGGFTLSGDCEIASIATGVIRCGFTEGAPFAPSATTDTTNATNISSGNLPAGRMPALTGDVTSSAGTVNTTLANVNSNVGSFGSTTNCPSFTVNAKGLITAASQAGCAFVSSITASTGLTGGVITGIGTIAIDKATTSNFFAGTSNKVVTADVVAAAADPGSTNVSGTVTLDFSTFVNKLLVLTGNITSFSCSNQPAGKSGIIWLKQNGTGGFTLPGTFGCNMTFPNALQPTFSSTAANALYSLAYSCSANNTCSGQFAGPYQ